MLRLKCKSQNYAWGKMGLESLVGQIHKVNNPDDADIDGQPFADGPPAIPETLYTNSSDPSTSMSLRRNVCSAGTYCNRCV